MRCAALLRGALVGAMLAALIRAGADVSMANDYGATATSIAPETGNARISAFRSLWGHFANDP